MLSGSGVLSGSVGGTEDDTSAASELPVGTAVDVGCMLPLSASTLKPRLHTRAAASSAAMQRFILFRIWLSPYRDFVWQRGYDTVSHPSAAVYEKPHAGERMGLMAYGPDKEKTALR